MRRCGRTDRVSDPSVALEADLHTAVFHDYRHLSLTAGVLEQFSQSSRIGFAVEVLHCVTLGGVMLPSSPRVGATILSVNQHGLFIHIG